ncbi:MAG: NAD(P)H-hydrate epimerase [Nitrososphaerota archaeon]|nr:NAD(P)H-hydrate epimerase [Nitrososphaerota archaeon]
MKSYDGMAYVTADEMRVLDEEAVRDYSLDVLSLMENAGTAVATVAWRMLRGSLSGRRVLCLVGKGNNGGDGLVAARRLHNWGAHVEVVLGGGIGVGEIAASQLETVEKMGLGVHEGWSLPSGTELLVDALLGYNSRGDPREPVAGLVRAANSSGVPILAVDIPSGLDPTSGEPGDPCIVGTATLSLGLPKSGFLNPRSRHYVGELYLGDVSIPRALYELHSYPVPNFDGSAVLSVRLPP